MVKRGRQIHSTVTVVTTPYGEGGGADTLYGEAGADTLHGKGVMMSSKAVPMTIRSTAMRGTISSVVVAVQTRSTVVPMTTYSTAMWGLIPSLVAPAMTV